MKLMNRIARYGKAKYAAAGALTSTPMLALATDSGGGGVSASAATEQFDGLQAEIAVVGGALLAAVALITAWKYIKAAAT